MNTQPIMTITKLLLMETGTYNDMALRPYQTNVDVNSLKAMQEATQNGANLRPGVLAGIAGDILRPSTQAQGVVTIQNGWDTPRLRFMMEVVHQGSALAETVQYITGYTDHLGVIWGSQSIDRGMQMHINNSITTRRVVEMTPVGRQNRQMVVSAAQVLEGSYQPTFGNLGNNMFTMRPQDVFMTMGATGMLDQSQQMFDTRAAFSAGNMKLSNRTNGSAPSYLSRIMSAYRGAMNGSDMQEDFAVLMEKAGEYHPEPMVHQDMFLGLATRQHTALAEHTWISYGELEQMSPNLEHVTTVVRRNGNDYMAHHERGVSEHWSGTTHETVMATILSHSVPSLMMDLMLTKLAFVVTNQTLDGQFAIQYGHVQGFAENVDMRPYVQAFEQRLIVEVLRDLSRSNQIGLNLALEMDVVGDTIIDVSINNGPSIRYVTPSFSDALMSPVITNNNQNLMTLASDVTSLVENLSVDHGPRASQYSPTHFQGPPGNDYGNSETV